MSEWVKVKDRLPNDKQLIIVYCNHQHETDKRVNGGAVYRNGKFWDFDIVLNHPIGLISDYIELHNVTHWMPLPDNPEI